MMERRLIRVVYEPNDEHRQILEACLKIDVPVAEVAARLDVGDKTFREAYADVIEAYELSDGRPEFIPTDQQRKIVQLAAASGIPQKDIGWLLGGISPGTVRRHFPDDIAKGGAQANLKVGGKLFEMATGAADAKNTALAAIWWSKARMGWKDTSRVEQTGPDGGPIRNQHQVVVVLPDNQRGDSNVPIVDSNGNLVDLNQRIVTGPPMTSYEDDSSGSEGE